VEDATGARAGEDQPPGMPRWVIALGMAVVFLVLIAGLAMLLLGVEHGPGRHR
jgi:hypothetical protein